MSGPRLWGNKSAARDATRLLSTLGQSPAEIRDGDSCSGKATSPRELKVGRWSPKGPAGRRPDEGRGRWRPGESRAPLTWPRCPAYLAEPGPRRPGAGLGSPLLGEVRPPETVGGGPELTCRRNGAATACQSSAPWAAPRRVLRPTSSAPPPSPSVVQ